MAIGIVGAGISGLALGHALRRQGKEVYLFEASGQPGGNIRSRTAEGFTTEAGPNTFFGEEPSFRALIESLGLTDQVMTAEPSVRKRFVFLQGKVSPLPRSPPQLLSWRAFSLGGRLRFLGELLARRAGDEDESVLAFARRRVGREMGDVLADLAQMGIYAGDPQRLSMRACFPALVEMERQHGSLLRALGKRGKSQTPRTLCTLRGGLQTLIQALAEQMGRALSLGSGVTAVGRSPSGWAITVSAPQGPRTVEVEQLALAVPAFAAAGLLEPIHPGLSAELKGIEYAPIATIHLGFETKNISADVEGFGILVPERERRTILGVIYASSAFPWKAPAGRSLFTCMVGGARHPELLEKSEAELISLASQDLQRMLGIASPPVFSRADKWPRGIPQYQLGHPNRLERIQKHLAELPDLYLLGNAYHGVGLHDCLRLAQGVAAKL